MRTAEVEVYKYAELAPEVQKKVMEKYRRDKEEGWLDSILSDWTDGVKDELHEEGFERPEIRYDLSYSQGSGFSFIGRINLHHFLKKHKMTKFKYLWLCENVDYGMRSNTSHYVYDKTVTIDYETRDARMTPARTLVADKVLEEMEKRYLELCERYEAEGYGIIEDALSDETIDEELRDASEEEFEKDGTRFRGE